MTSAPSTASFASSYAISLALLSLNLSDISSANFSVLAKSLATILTSSRLHAASIASSWQSAWPPVPIRQPIFASFLANNLKAAPDAAPVRNLVIKLPSIRANTSPFLSSMSSTCPIVVASPRALLPGNMFTILMPAAPSFEL